MIQASKQEANGEIKCGMCETDFSFCTCMVWYIDTSKIPHLNDSRIILSLMQFPGTQLSFRLLCVMRPLDVYNVCPST